VNLEQTEHTFGDPGAHGGQVETLADEAGDAGQLLGLPLLPDDLGVQLGPGLGERARGLQLALEVGNPLAEPGDLVLARA